MFKAECHQERLGASRTIAPRILRVDEGTQHLVLHKCASPWANGKREEETSGAVPSGNPASTLSFGFVPGCSELVHVHQASPVNPSGLLLWNGKLPEAPGEGPVARHHWVGVANTSGHWGRHQRFQWWRWPHVWYAGSWWCGSPALVRQNLGTVPLPGFQRDKW